jgi:hypothetical protein
MARHLNPRGILIVEPWLRPQEWQPGKLHALFVDEPDLKIARMSLPGREGDVSTIRFEYLIATPGRIDHEVELHRLGLFTDDQYSSAFRNAGIEPRLISPGLTARGLFVGEKA